MSAVVNSLKEAVLHQTSVKLIY